MNPPRLLIATTVATTLKAFLIPYARHFRARGWIVDALAHGATTSHECREEFCTVYEAEWVRRSANPLVAAKSVLRTRLILASHEYDIVHVHTPAAAFLTRLAARTLPKSPQIVYTVHGFHFHPLGGRVNNAAFFVAEKMAGRWTDELIVINEEDYRAANKGEIVQSDRLTLVKGIGIDLEAYSPGVVGRAGVEAFKGALRLSDESPLFSMVAEFNPGKRHEDAIRGLVLSGQRNAHLALAGTGPMIDSMRALADRLGVSGRVHFLGFRRDVPTILASSTASILPSLREGLPRAALESLALGIPVIGTTIRGVEELLRGGGGILVPPKDPAAIGHAIARLATDIAYRESRSRSALNAVSDYALTGILEQHSSIYERCLTRKR